MKKDNAWRGRTAGLMAVGLAAAIWGAVGSAADAEPGKREVERGSSAEAPERWTIVLASFSGEDHAAAANQALERVRGMEGLGAARAQERGRGSVVVAGEFASPGSEEAQKELARVRAIQVNGQAVFAGAFLAPPRNEESAAGSRHELRSAREEFGKSVRYTLQIGVYEAKDREEAKRAAEAAASALRREGEPAYYSHGPARSMVTVGAFTEKDVKAFLDRGPGQTTGAGAPELWELFRRHPQNLLNGNLSLVEKSSAAGTRAPGSGAKSKGGTSPGRVQASFLVEIP